MMPVENPLVDKADFVHIKKLMSKIEIKSTPLPPALALFGQAGWAGEPQIAKLLAPFSEFVTQPYACSTN